MEDVTLSWPGSMTTDQAKKYLLTAGFVPVELFRQQTQVLATGNKRRKYIEDRDSREPTMEDRDSREPTMEEVALRARKDLQVIEKTLRDSLDLSVYDRKQSFRGQHGEMKGQTMLAVRHIEDARMRCGKILQYADDGVSILDKPGKKNEGGR